MPFSRGIYYTEDSSDNWKLAKCHTRSSKDRWDHSKPHIGGFSQMTPQEVLDMLEELGIKRDVRTLQRYVKMDLVPKPLLINRGRGTGKISDYPNSTPNELYGSIYLKEFRKASFQEIKEARMLVKMFEKEIEENPSLLDQHRTVGDKQEEQSEHYKRNREVNEILIKASALEFYLFRTKGLSEELFKLAVAWFYLSQNREFIIKDIFRKMMKEDKNSF